MVVAPNNLFRENSKYFFLVYVSWQKKKTLSLLCSLTHITIFFILLYNNPSITKTSWFVRFTNFLEKTQTLLSLSLQCLSSENPFFLLWFHAQFPQRITIFTMTQIPSSSLIVFWNSSTLIKAKFPWIRLHHFHSYTHACACSNLVSIIIFF